MLSVANLQRSTNQNHNEISPRTCQNDYYFLKNKKHQKYDEKALSYNVGDLDLH